MPLVSKRPKCSKCQTYKAKRYVQIKHRVICDVCLKKIIGVVPKKQVEK